MSTPACVVAAGGTLETAMLPGRLLGLRADWGIDVAAALSPGALDFVTLTAMRAVTGREVYSSNDQLDPSCLPLHLVYGDARLLVLHPASARIIAQCATGQISCAVTRLFAFTPKDRIAIAPAVHARMDRRIYEPHIATLRGLGCAVLGGNDLHADWPAVEQYIVDRLGAKRASAGSVVRLDDLIRSRS